MVTPSNPQNDVHSSVERVVQGSLVALEYAIALSLLVIAAVVLVRTVITFFYHWGGFPETVVQAIDGVLVVVILLDIAHTVLGHLRTSTFPVRPLLVIGILAGVRDILSASARLTFDTSLHGTNFMHTLVSLSLGVGVVVALSLSLLMLGFTRRQ